MIFKKLTAILTYKHLPWIALIIGLVLGLPTLLRGWGLADDLLQRDFILSSTLPETLTRLYVFLDASTNLARMDAGVLPWWTLETAQVMFFRPLSAFSLWLDYQLWPDSSTLAHLHSLLWYGALCWLAASLYRRLLGNTTSAGLAAILFSISVVHIGFVFSLAARNILLTGFFGFLTIIFHDRWQKNGWRAGAFLSPLCLVISLLFAEMGVATSAYLLAYAIFLGEGTWKKRLISIIPYILVILAWWLAYQFYGYGAWGSDFYLNPGKEPLQFAWGVLTRAPLVLLGQWVLPDPIVYAVLSFGVKTLYWVLAIIILSLIGLLLSPLIRKDRVARFWTTGMLLSVIPVCAVSLPSGRHLVFISLGALGLMSQFIVEHLTGRERLPGTRNKRLAAGRMVSFIFLGLHAFLYPFTGTFLRPILDSYGDTITGIGSLSRLEGRDVIIVNAPDPGQLIYLPAVRRSQGLQMPAHLRLLAPGFSSILLTRVDEYSLIVQPEDGYLLSPAIPERERLFTPFADPSYGHQYGDGLFRGGAYPMELGEQVVLTGMRVEVTSMTEDGRPQEARIQFTLPLENEQYVWLVWDWESSQYLPFSPPEVGKTALVPGALETDSPINESPAAPAGTLAP